MKKVSNNVQAAYEQIEKKILVLNEMKDEALRQVTNIATQLELFYE